MSKFMKLLPINLNDNGKIKKPISTLDETSPTNIKPELHVPIVMRNMPNWIFVWLDANIDETNDPDCQNTLTELRQVVNTINIFVDTNQCMNFLMNNHHAKILMIVSGSIGKNIVPLVHNISQLISIYIFCGDQSKHEHWVKKWSKIKGVFTEISPICNELKQVGQRYDRDSIPISIVSMSDEISTTELNQLDQSFMHTQILKEILLDIDFEKKKYIKEFTTDCRRLFANNEKELNIINTLEHKYSKFTPIWWYTNECFLHRMLNHALRTMDVDIIIKMGFFIRDLHRHIEELHEKQFTNIYEMQIFIVYRGQGLCKTDFDKIMKTKGGLISFNNFLSTSKKENIARLYARRAMNDAGLIGVVFKMIINPWISSTPFALINDVSFFKGSEQEILFSMHTVFRIRNIYPIEFENDQLWEVELILTSDSDQQLNKLTQRTREESRGLKGWFRVGQLLIKLGQFGKAEELYDVLLNQKSNKMEKAYIYHQLGWIKVNIGKYADAISSFEKSLSITEKILPLNYPDLATCYDNIGLVYDHMNESMIALSFHVKALEIYRATLESDHPDLATSLSNIGSVYRKLNDYEKALLSYEEALHIYRQKLPSNHSSLAILYNNIGLVHDKNNNFSKALWFYDKTLEIYRNTMPSTHPDSAILHQNIGKTLEKMCEYDVALSHYEKALAIFQTNFPSDHRHLATCFTHIASVYNNMNEYSKALPLYEKALDIRQSSLPPHHPDLIASYDNMGEIYHHMNEYSLALSFYEKVFEIYQTTLAPDDPLLANAYYKIAKVYSDMSCYSKALSYIEQAITIAQRALPRNYSDLQTYSETLELIQAML